MFSKTRVGYGILTILVLAMGVYWGQQLFFQPAKAVFLPGKTTSAHHQIELACGTCHQSPFGGGEVLQNACVGCHGAELKAAHDSHPKTKFTDPRNADRVEILDARFCTTCHREHQPDITRPMAVTMPVDYCFGCHQKVAEDRPSHKGMAFDTCASAGCHNYHDNRALYEDFLLAHANEPDIKPVAVIPAMQNFVMAPAASAKPVPVPDYPQASLQADQATTEWHQSGHAHGDVNCSGCHGKGPDFHARPDPLVCIDCHKPEARGFLSGKHGADLPADDRPGGTAQ